MHPLQDTLQALALAQLDLVGEHWYPTQVAPSAWEAGCCALHCFSLSLCSCLGYKMLWLTVFFVPCLPWRSDSSQRYILSPNCWDTPGSSYEKCESLRRGCWNCEIEGLWSSFQGPFKLFSFCWLALFSKQRSFWDGYKPFKLHLGSTGSSLSENKKKLTRWSPGCRWVSYTGAACKEPVDVSIGHYTHWIWVESVTIWWLLFISLVFKIELVSDFLEAGQPTGMCPVSPLSSPESPNQWVFAGQFLPGSFSGGFCLLMAPQ